MRLRRTMLFMPGNNPGMIENAGVYGADSIILDLEDAVSPNQKDAARLLVGEALKDVDFNGSEKVVRINSLDTFGMDDIKTIVPCCPDALIIPKVETADTIHKVSALVHQVNRVNYPIKFIALIETPKGIANSYEIAQSDPDLEALALGAEDYTASLGISRSKTGEEIYVARSILVNSAAAGEIQSIDTPFTDVNDPIGLKADVSCAKKMGFKGKLSINPRQLDIIHQVYKPSDDEIHWATQIIMAIDAAKSSGAGVASIHGKMVDAPVVSRARTILYLAEKMGIKGENKE